MRQLWRKFPWIFFILSLNKVIHDTWNYWFIMNLVMKIFDPCDQLQTLIIIYEPALEMSILQFYICHLYEKWIVFNSVSSEIFLKGIKYNCYQISKRCFSFILCLIPLPNVICFPLKTGAWAFWQKHIHKDNVFWKT